MTENGVFKTIKKALNALHVQGFFMIGSVGGVLQINPS
jgi:hypothetical protein